MHFTPGGASACKIALLYAGSVIGAGFASGQEILQFFIIFGKMGLWGGIMAAVLFCYLGGLVMHLSVAAASTNYRDLYRSLLGRTLEKAMDFLSLVMLPGGVVVMLAGGGAVFSEHLGLPQFLGTLLTALITAAVISMGLQGVISANVALVPLKLAAIVIICLLALAFAGPETEVIREDTAFTAGNQAHWAWSAVLYVSYNMVVPVAVLSTLGRVVQPRAGVLGGMAGGAVLGAVACLVVVTGLCFYPGLKYYEVPLLYIAGSLGPAVKTVLGMLIWVAILTTAIADTHGFASRFASSRSPRYRVIGIGLVLCAMPLSSLKFSFLVKLLYPLFGYGGLILLGALVFIPPVRAIRRKLL